MRIFIDVGTTDWFVYSSVVVPPLRNQTLNRPSPLIIQKPGTYTSARLTTLFNKYVDEEAEDEPTIGPEGLMRLCEEAGMPMEGALELPLHSRLKETNILQLG